MFEEFLQVHDSDKIQKLKDLRINESKEIKDQTEKEKEEIIGEKQTLEESKEEKKKKDLKLFSVKVSFD